MPRPPTSMPQAHCRGRPNDKGISETKETGYEQYRCNDPQRGPAPFRIPGSDGGEWLAADNYRPAPGPCRPHHLEPAEELECPQPPTGDRDAGGIEGVRRR